MPHKENQDFDTQNLQEMLSTKAPLQERKSVFKICVLETDCVLKYNQFIPGTIPCSGNSVTLFICICKINKLIKKTVLQFIHVICGT